MDSCDNNTITGMMHTENHVQTPCPSCGHCAHCGRSNATPWTTYPYYPYYIPWYPNTTPHWSIYTSPNTTVTC